MARLHIPVGIPGCGKSTFVHRFGGDYTVSGARSVSTDSIRAELGDINDQSRNNEVFDMYHQQIATLLLNNADTYADATNLRDFARERLRRIAERTNAETHLWVFTNTAQAIERNAKRERRVPDDVMLRMVEQYEQALKDIAVERYTTVTYIADLQ